MLVLGRNANEVVVIELPNGETVRVTVVDVVGKKVRVGFEASSDIKIHREEIYERINFESEFNKGYLNRTLSQRICNILSEYNVTPKDIISNFNGVQDGDFIKFPLSEVESFLSGVFKVDIGEAIKGYLVTIKPQESILGYFSPYLSFEKE